MQSRFYCPSFAYCRFSLRDAGRGRRPFPFLPQARACTPLGNNLSPVCGQCRRRFRFTAAVPLPPGCRKGPPPLPLSAFFRRRGRVPRQETICPPSAVNAVSASDLPPPFLFLRGCRKGPPLLPLSSAGESVYPVRRQFVPRQWSMPSALPIHRRRPFRSLPPARKQFVPRLRSMPTALPIHRRRSSSSGDAGRGRRPFRFLPHAGACTPPRSDFLFVRTQRLAVLFHFIRSENFCRRKIASDS